MPVRVRAAHHPADTVRLYVLTAADDGRPLLYGIPGANASWSREEFGPIESDLRLVLDFGCNEPFSLFNASSHRFLADAAAISKKLVPDGRPPASSPFTALHVQLIAVLTAMRAFLDHADRRLKAEFGARSAERTTISRPLLGSTTTRALSTDSSITCATTCNTMRASSAQRQQRPSSSAPVKGRSLLKPRCSLRVTVTPYSPTRSFRRWLEIG